MSSHQQKKPLYPTIIDDSHIPILSTSSASPNAIPTSSSLYPSLSTRDLAESLFPDEPQEEDPKKSNVPPPVEEVLLRIPSAILHLIDRQRSVQLASGDFSVLRVRQGPNSVAVLARIGEVQWPLARDEASVKLDPSHYFFSLRNPFHDADDDDDKDDDERLNLLNYGLTFPSKGHEHLLAELDKILESCSSFSVQKVGGKAAKSEVLDWSAGPAAEKNLTEERSAAYWTTLAPNVEDYGGSAARLIAKGSGKLIQGILWCGDVTVDRLKWGEDILKRRIGPNEKPSEVSKDALKRIKRVKRVTKMSEGVVTGILSGVVRVSGFFTSSVVNSKVGKKFFGLLPGEILLASLDGFAKICDAAEISGRNVLQTSSTVTTGLVSHRYGEQAAEVTNESFSAAGHAMGTAWAVFKIRKALNPKSVVKPTTLAKSAAKAVAAEHKTKKGKK
ncbi:uncharacterized protein M6B38_162825 [Iris pallida]|uniref:Senescence domain-containing protein n=1 Tax=Iris pallida TaxID=29817 RepID=A0AAX6F0N7_IRIPA|nr:uncharacterized protein M6B38_162825 [Iris pallida]